MIADPVSELFTSYIFTLEKFVLNGPFISITLHGLQQVDVMVVCHMIYVMCYELEHVGIGRNIQTTQTSFLRGRIFIIMLTECLL